MIQVPAEMLQHAMRHLLGQPGLEVIAVETMPYKPDDGKPDFGVRHGDSFLSLMGMDAYGDFEALTTVGIASEDVVRLGFNVTIPFSMRLLEAVQKAQGNVSLEETKINEYDYLRVSMSTPDGPVTLDGDWADVDDL